MEVDEEDEEEDGRNALAGIRCFQRVFEPITAEEEQEEVVMPLRAFVVFRAMTSDILELQLDLLS